MTTRASLASYSIINALSDGQLFAPWFTPAEHWRAWTVFVRALFALAMSEAEADLYRQHTGR
jgi:hypothetical protein